MYLLIVVPMETWNVFLIENGITKFQILKALANRGNMLANIWTNMLVQFAILYSSKQKATNILGFSFIRLLTIYQECQSVKQQHA